MNNSCEWTGELGELEMHLQSCALVQCTNGCKNKEQTVKVLRKDLQDHLTNKCPRRQYQCPHCEEMGEHQERTTSHLNTCPKVEVTCPNAQCQVSISRREISTHRSTCDYEPVSCKYAEVGCKEKPLRKEVKKHEEDAQLHLQLTSKKVLELSKKVAELTSQQTKLTVVPFIVVMKDFQKYKSINGHFDCPPFYTSHTGYKMYLSVYANGAGSGKGTHVSVGATLMKGDNDDFLVWPFQGEMITELLNQLEDKNHHKMNVTFPDPYRKYSGRVKDNEIPSVKVWGQSQFISHTDLEYQPFTNCQYLKDDMLIFKVFVEVHNPHPRPWLVHTAYTV